MFRPLPQFHVLPTVSPVSRIVYCFSLIFALCFSLLFQSDIRPLLQSGIVAACRSELALLEQLQTQIDPLGGCRGASSPHQSPALLEIRGELIRLHTDTAATFRRTRPAAAHDAIIIA